MKRQFFTVAAVIILSAAMWAAIPLQAQSSPWATAYYAGWQQGYNNTGYLPAQNVDYTAMTHIIHFALVPKSDGTLDDQSNSVTAFNANQLVTRAHAAGKKVMICVGGANSEAGFLGATSSAYLSTFITNLVSLMQTRGYDGIDIDWEPLASTDASQFTTFVSQLRSALDAVSPRPLLTTANGDQAATVAPVKDKFDQINIMTYDMAGAWPGWVTWHNSPIYDGGFNFPSTGNPVPSANGDINTCLAAGIPASKLSIGIDFYGYVWSGGAGTTTGGATQPRQSWTTAPTVTANVPYSTIMDTYYQPQYARFDTAAGVSYLSIDNSGSANDKFISYDDEATIANKFNYVRTKGLGGVIIWEIGGGYRANQPAGQQDKLLQAVKLALGNTSVDVTPPTIAITSPTSGASLTGVVAIAATASDNVGVAGVQFKVDGTNIGAEVTVAPFTASLNVATLSAGAHTISATARDAAGNTTTASVNITVILGVPDITPPTVAITSPANNATVSGTITIAANASDNVGVAGVQFTVDGTNAGNEITAVPYSTSLNTASYANGSHVLAAIARDAAGNKTTASISVTTANSTGGSSADLAVYLDALASPWINSSWSATIAFNSTEQVFSGSSSIKTTTTAWGGLSFHDGNWGASTSVSPASYSSFNFEVYALSSGTQLTIYGQNDQGQSFPNVSYGTIAPNQWVAVSVPMNQLSPAGQTIQRISIQETSGSTKTFYVDNIRFAGTAQTPPASSDTTKPTVVFTAPANNATVAGNVSLSVNAADNVKVMGVQFKIDGTNIGSELTAAPYNLSWNSTQIANGTHSLSAVARDSAGNTGTASVAITVANSQPPANSTLVVYDDSLHSPWINTSWSATITFGSTDQKNSGSSSIKVVQSAWGGLRLHNGSWGAPVSVNTSTTSSVQFAVYGGTNGVSLGLWLENDKASSFPAISYVSIPANQWQSLEYPMSQLNPNNYAVNSLVIQDMTGKSTTFYVDDIQFIGSPQSSAQATDVQTISGTGALPQTFALNQNFPNPFNPSTAISYSLPFAARVKLEVFNTLGQRVSVLVDGEQNAGVHGVTFNALSFPSGAYFYRISALSLGDHAEPFVMTKRMILMK
ncbi:MAG TPA: glycosyl hydrolase family 18 protein [Bacteroidota bacterium]|nr:glycosyl hydrolase family 18 protein [Bacteroidota bacterium]